MKSFSDVFNDALIKDSSGVLNGFKTDSFRQVLLLLDSNRKKYIDDIKKDAHSEEVQNLMKWSIIAFEEEQKEPRFLRWNVTAYAPKENKREFSYQFCSPPPDCTRIFLKFNDEGNAEMTISPPCIIKNPDLSAIRASIGSGSERKETLITLKQTQEQLKESGIQSIAIAGFARNFPYYDPEIDKELKQEELVKKALYQHRAEYATEAIDSFISQLESLHIAFTTVNGGWAGQEQKPREAGITFMGHLHGVVHEADDSSRTPKSPEIASPKGGFYPPLTVMPKGGSSDSVSMIASLPGFSEEAKLLEGIVADTLGSRSQFVIEGDWGSDSPYLAALSSSMIVIEPAGRWTQIEMLNAMEQGRPVVILASPENFDKNWMKEWGVDQKIDRQYAGLTKGQLFVEIPLPTKSDPKATVRAYRNPADAAIYINWRYTVDHLSPEVSTMLKTEAGQNSLKKAMAFLSASMEDKKEALTAKNISEIAKIMTNTPEIQTQLVQVLTKKIQGLAKSNALEELQHWVSPDDPQNIKRINTARFAPTYLTGIRSIWHRPALSSPPKKSGLDHYKKKK